MYFCLSVILLFVFSTHSPKNKIKNIARKRKNKQMLRSPWSTTLYMCFLTITTPLTSFHRMRQNCDKTPWLHRSTQGICMLAMPLESSAGTNVWPVERPALILIQPTLPLGIKTLLNQDRGKGKRWTEEYQVEKGTDVLQSKAGKANIVFRKSYCWWHRRGVVFPVCVPCASTSSCPPCL